MNQPSLIGVVLASGFSRRFGTADKLMAELGGKPLVSYAASALLGVLPDAAFAITPHRPSPRANLLAGMGLRIVENERNEQGMGTSIALAASLADECGATGLLLVLGDMPFVSVQHLKALIGMKRAGCVSATAPGRPPVVFDRSQFAALKTLTGDHGARQLLHGADLVPTVPPAGFDIDTPHDLITAEKLFL